MGLVWRTGAGGPRGLVRLRGRIRGGPSGPSSAGLPGRAGNGGGRLSPKRHSPRPAGSGDLLAQAAICGGRRNPAGRQTPGCSSQRKLRAAALARFVLQTNLCRPDTRLLWYPHPRYLLPVVDKLRRAVLVVEKCYLQLMSPLGGDIKVARQIMSSLDGDISSS